MRIRLFHKLLLALETTSLASIVLFAFVAQVYLGKSFVRYINEAQAQRLEQLAETAAEHYAEHGDWRALEGNRRAWRRMMRSAARDGDAFDERGPPRPRPPHHPGHRPPRPSLYDGDYRLVAGDEPFREGMTLRPVTVAGQTVGWTGVPALKRPASRRDVRFAERQAAMIGIAATIAVLLSFAIAVPSARRLAGPITRIGGAARALASGRLDTRLEAKGADEIGALASDFNVLARTLEDNDAARRRWIADVSHELRTPLAVMRGELEAVRDGIRPAGAAIFDSLEQEVTRLSSLVDDLYQLARADVGALEYAFEPCRLDTLVEESLQRFAPRFEAAGLAVHPALEPGVTIEGDTRRLAQLLDNLLENCARYVDAPGEVRLVLARAGRNAELRIDDSGPAPDMTDLNALFEPLARGEQSRSRADGGAGLGLALCLRIAAAHGGTIRAERNDAGGFGIRVRLPRTDSP